METGGEGRRLEAMASVPRRLREAVVNCLHPATLAPPPEALRTLQEYLSSSELVDTVYMQVLDRSTAEPLSPQIVANALRLLKSILTRQAPSLPVLEAVLAFTIDTPARLLAVPSVRPGVALNQEIRSGLLYIQALVQAQAGLVASDYRSGGRMSMSPSSQSSTTSSSTLHYHHHHQQQQQGGGAGGALRPSSLLLLQQQLHHRSVSEGGASGVSRDLAAVPHQGASQHLSAADLTDLRQLQSGPEKGLQDGSSRFVRHLFNASLGGSESGASESGTAAAQPPPVSAAQHHHQQGSGGVLVAEGDGPRGAAREDKSCCYGPGGGLQEGRVMRNAMANRYPAGASRDPDSFHEVQWGLARMPEAASSLAPMLMEVGQDSFRPPSELGIYEEAEQCIAVTDVLETRRNIATVATVQRVQAAAEGGGKEAKDRSAHQMSSMLFQYRPYSEQMPLRLSQADVAAVVEAVKGEQPGSSTSPAGAELALNDSVLWGRSLGRGSMASVCSSLLMKVVMDLWLDAGSAVSFPVVLEMLQDMVYSERPHLQERAFDIIYNLSLHAQLLHPADPGTVEASGMEGGAAAEGGGGGTAGHVEAMEAWLRRLLFAILPILPACRTQPEEVWAAALGALLHLTTSGGAWHTPFVSGLSLGVVRGLLKAVERFGWTPELYCHLVRLATHLMYEENAAAARGSTSGSANGPTALLRSRGANHIGDEGTEESGAAKAPASLRAPLNLDNLERFGGGQALMMTFMAAMSSESRKNVFCLLFDLAVVQLREKERRSGGEGRQGGGGGGGGSVTSDEDVAAVAALIQRTELVHVMRPLILCQQPGIAQQLAEWVKELLAHGRALHMSGSESDLREAMAEGHKEEGRIELLQVVLEEIEALAASTLSGTVPRPLSGAVEATMAVVAGSSGAADGAWDCIRDLLWSPLPDVASIGAEWLSQLLVAAAERHTEAMWDATAAEDGVAVLPALPQGQGVKSKGLPQQPELSALLAATLGDACPGGGPPRLFLGAVERLLHRLKVGYPDDLASPSGSQETTRGHLKTRLCSSILATLELAVEWILAAPPRCRQPALLHASLLLLSLLTVPSNLCMGRPGCGGPGDGGCGETVWGEPQLDAACEIQAFLGGQVSVPISVLKLVPLGLLVRLFGNLLVDGGEPESAVHRLCFRGPSCSDLRSSSSVEWAFTSPSGGSSGNVRSGLLLLVIGRCSVETTTLKMLGGEGWFHRLLNDQDPNVRYYAAVFLLKRLMSLQPARYHKALHRLLLHAQQTDDHDLLKNPYLQMSAMLEMKLVDG